MVNGKEDYIDTNQLNSRVAEMQKMAAIGKKGSKKEIQIVIS